MILSPRRTNLRERFKQFRSSPDNTGQKRPATMRCPELKNLDCRSSKATIPASTKLDLEVRHPFLDLRLVEFLLAIPAAPWCVNKHILRSRDERSTTTRHTQSSKNRLAGDPALQLVRRASVRWLDSFEVSPQLRAFVNLNRRRSIADEQTPDGLWASLRVFALNYWLTNSQPIARRRRKIRLTKSRDQTSIA